MTERSVLKAFDETWGKFKKFVDEDVNRPALAALPEETKKALDFLLARDVLVILPDVVVFFEDEANKKAVIDKDEAFLKNLLPPEVNVGQIPDASKAKFFLFARVALSLIRDYHREQNECPSI